MQYPSAEPKEVPDAKGTTFEHFDLVVNSFCIAVGVRYLERVEDLVLPSDDAFHATVELREVAGSYVHTPLGKSLLNFCERW